MKKLGALQKLKGMSVEQRSLIAFGSALVLLLMLMFFAFVPFIEEALLAKEKAGRLEERLVAYQELSEKENYPQLVEEQKIKLVHLEKRLPKKLQQASIMEELHTAADSCGVKITVLKAVKQGSSSKQSIALQMECKGNYMEILKFLRRVEKEGSFKILQEFVAKGDERNGSLELATVVSAYKS